MASTLLKPWSGFTGYNAYPYELARDMRVLDTFLKDLRAAVGKGLGETQITNTSVTNVTTSTQVAAGVDLDGGGPLTSDITIDHADSAVTPGSYLYATFVINQRGHITSAVAVSLPGPFTQTYAAASHTHPDLTSTAVATTAATNVVPYGYSTQAQADDIITQLNKLRTDLDNLKQLVNGIIDDGQSLGLLQ